METTITSLAAEFDMEPHGVRAALDLGDLHDDEAPIELFGWTSFDARQALRELAETAAGRE